MTKTDWVALLLILIVAAAARASLLWVAVEKDNVGAPDSGAYRDLAWSMARSQLFADGGYPEINRTPGYPFFAAVAHVLSGGDQMGGWLVVLVLQALLDVGLVFLTFLLGRLLVGHGVGLGAALFQAISPVAAASSCRALPDSLYAFCLTAALLLIVGHLKTGKIRRLVWAGVVMALACYVRPVGMIMAAVVVVALLCRPGRFRRAGAFAGVFVACIAPWVIRNTVVADYCGFSSNGGDTLYYFYAPEIAVSRRDIDGETARQEMWEEARRYAEEHNLTVGAAARWRQRKGLGRIAAHPWLYTKIHLKGSLGFWLPGATDVLELGGLTRGNRGTLEVLKKRGLVAAARHYFGDIELGCLTAGPMVLILLVMYAGVAACVVVGLRRRAGAAASLLAAVVVVSMMLTGPFGLPRYRVPVEPILNVAAAVGLGAVFARTRRPARQTGKPAGGS